MKRKLLFRHVAVLSTLALLLTACPDDNDVDVEDEPDVEEPEDEPDEEEEEEAIDRPDVDPDQLHLGYILPETGDLAFLSAPQIQAVQLAVDDINEAGGVLGNEVTLQTGDSGGEGPIVRETAARLINAGVDAIIGAAASGMSLEIIDTLRDNEIVQCSGSNTSPAFLEANNEYYFRTVPPDQAVAPIIAQEVIGDGFTNPAVIARADDYGVALLDLVVEELETQVDVSVNETYSPDDPDFGALVTEITGAGADAVVVIGFGEALDGFRQLIEGGMSPDSLYGGDGVFSPALPEDVGVDVDGLKVIGAAGGAEFNERLNERLADVGEEGNLIYGGQVYDCTVTVALAAIAAESADPAVFNDFVEDVTRDGTECESFQECAELLEAGEDIDYQGASGPINLERPDPTFGRYAVGEFQNGELVIVGDHDVDLTDVE